MSLRVGERREHPDRLAAGRIPESCQSTTAVDGSTREPRESSANSVEAKANEGVELVFSQEDVNRQTQETSTKGRGAAAPERRWWEDARDPFSRVLSDRGHGRCIACSDPFLVLS